MKNFLILLFILCSSLLTKGQSKSSVFRNNMNGDRDSVNWINESTITSDSGSTNHFSETDSAGIYGIGFREILPAKFSGANIFIAVNVRFRNLNGADAGALAFSILRNDSTIIWDSKDLHSDNGNWKMNKLSFFLPSNFVNTENTLLIYCWNKNKPVICQFDDLEIEIGFLPQKTTLIPVENNTTSNTESFPVVLSGSKYRVEIDSSEKKLRVISNSGDTVLSSFGVLLETYSKKKSVLKPVTFFLAKATSLTFDNSVERISVRINYRSLEADAEVNVIVNNLSGNLSLETKMRFNINLRVKRAALLIDSGIPVRSVIKENGEIKTYKQDDHWIKYGQVVFAGKNHDYITDRNPDRSSLQLIGGRLIMNLDFAEDHPMSHFPLKRKNENYFYDVSEKEYQPGSEISGQINFSVIDSGRPIVRLLNNPDGIPASFVWTEHADFSDIRTQRAVMFGSEKITLADSATGGFAGNGIPVTKSVFYDNPTQEKNSEKDKRFESASVSITQSPEFLDLLKQLKKKDFEICLHTPDPYTTTVRTAEEAMKFMQENFQSVNWIDHGYDNSPVSNREDVNCEGLDRNSEYYMGDLFKKYDVKYVWSSYYEDNGTFADRSFNSFFTNPYSGWNDPYAAPEYFRNPVNDSLISWSTTFTLDPPDGSLWDYYFADVRLNDLVQSKGSCILHCYLARVDSTTGFYSHTENGIVINPELNKALIKLRKYADEKKIWITTVEKLIGYRLQLEKISISYIRNDQIMIYNANDSAVKGVSIITEAENVSAGEKNIRLKKEGQETIAVFDLAPKEKLILDLR